MSGVIVDGVQWEHCCACQDWVRLTNLGYEKPTAAHKHGRDLCVSCVDAGIRDGSIDFDNIEPAKSWLPVEVDA